MNQWMARNLVTVSEIETPLLTSIQFNRQVDHGQLARHRAGAMLVAFTAPQLLDQLAVVERQHAFFVRQLSFAMACGSRFCHSDLLPGCSHFESERYDRDHRAIATACAKQSKGNRYLAEVTQSAGPVCRSVNCDCRVVATVVGYAAGIGVVYRSRRRTH